MRPLLFWLHRWFGIVLALYVVVICVTGALLVFHDEIADAVRVPAVNATPDPRLDADAIVSTVKAAFPNWHLQTLWWPASSRSPWMAEVRQGVVGAIGETALAVYVHPQTGAILKTHNYSRSVWRWLQLAHFNLLSGRDGRTANGVLALASIFVLLTGAILWLPRDYSRGPVLTISRVAANRRFAWELHQVTGIYLLPFFMVLCLTGAYFAWRAPVHQALASVFAMRFMSTAIAPITPAPTPPLKPLESFIPTIASRVPGYPVTRVIFPEQPNQPIRFVVYEGSRAEFFKASNLFFHPGSGELLRADLYGERANGDSVVSWIGAVHYGAFGSWLSKALWVASGLGVAISALTGIWIVLAKASRR